MLTIPLSPREGRGEAATPLCALCILCGNPANAMLMPAAATCAATPHLWRSYEDYRVAMLGCRSRGTSAARAYNAHPRIEVVGLCDLIQERLDTLGDELGVSARFTDLDKMIRQAQPDLVAIPTGTEFHYPLAMRVLEHGVNIEVEKPMCTDLAEADEVLAKAKAQGVRVAVHHQGRVGGSMRAMARAYAAGRIGKLRYIYASDKGYYGGYGLMNIGVHLLNYVIKFAGHCRSLTATALTAGHLITPEDVIPSANGMGTIAGENITATLQHDDNVTSNLLLHRFPTVDSTPPASSSSAPRPADVAQSLDLVAPDAALSPRRAARQLAGPGGRGPRPLRPPRPGRAGRLLVCRGVGPGAGRRPRSRSQRHRRPARHGDYDGRVRIRRLRPARPPPADPARPSPRPLAARARLGRSRPMPRPYADWLAAEDRRLGRTTA